MKVAVIGNSHVGCLKRGWDQISDTFPTTDLVFFASRGQSMEGLRVSGTTLVPGTKNLLNDIHFTSGGLSEIDLATFDAALVYGLDFQAFFATDRPFFSRQAQARALEDFLQGRFFLRLINTIKQASGLPLYIGHQPLPAHKASPDTPNTNAYALGMQMLSSSVFDPLDVTVITQPADTIVNVIHTAPAFTKASKRLAVGDRWDDQIHPDDDTIHMNDAYGERWLRAFFEKVSD